MKMSKMFLPTLKEVPADAEIRSHQLMIRSGMIKKMSSGVYNQLPIGLRVFVRSFPLRNFQHSFPLCEDFTIYYYFIIALIF